MVIKKEGHVIHRASKELIGLLDKLCDALGRESGFRPTKSQVVELAIRELAEKKKVR